MIWCIHLLPGVPTSNDMAVVPLALIPKSSGKDLALPKSSKKVALLPKSSRMDLLPWRSFRHHQGWTWRFQNHQEGGTPSEIIKDGVVALAFLPKSSRMDLALPKSSKKVALLPESSRIDLLLWRSA
jgi:hypothetical protein